ncbi:hypothetical protein [Pseudorhodoferax sp.]|uniref:hypothetical protein n=1 Tax=Pseudorhodoferax sp. TaxID=1993553 RepID=UPI002DD647BD|nr:hypothetical protein [Pseudorhodoferax sp.]
MNTHHEERFTTAHWEELLQSIDLEVAQMAIVCRVPLLAPGAAARVLARDSGVAGVDNPLAFAKLRNLLAMHYAVSCQMIDEVGGDAAADITQHVREHLAPRIGHQLDAPPPDA